MEEEYKRWTDNEKVHPEHYNNSNISVFDVWDDWNLDPYLGTVLKYIKRAGSKNGESEISDLEKAVDFLLERIKRLKENDVPCSKVYGEQDLFSFLDAEYVKKFGVKFPTLMYNKNLLQYCEMIVSCINEERTADDLFPFQEEVNF